MAIRFQGQAADATGLSQMVVADNPLYRGDSLTFSILAASAPSPLPEVVSATIGATSFGDWQLVSQRFSVNETLIEFSAQRLADEQTYADAVTAILDADYTLDVDDPELPAVHLRWNAILDGNTTGDLRILKWIRQRFARKGDRPSLATYERELPKYGFTLALGQIPPFSSASPAISVIPLEWVNPGDKRTIAATAQSTKSAALAPPLTRDMSFTAAGVEYRSGGTTETDAEGNETHTPGGYHINLGQASTLGEGAVLLEMRRYQGLLTGERREVLLELDPTYSIRDLVSYGGQDYIVVGAQHESGGKSAQTELSLLRRYTPTQAQIQAGSPPPYDTTLRAYNAAPDAPMISIVYEFTAPSDASQYAGESVNWRDVGGGTVAIITPPVYGHPLTKYSWGITQPGSTQPYERAADIPNPPGSGATAMPILNMPAGNYAITVRAHNAFGASSPATAVFDITAGTPEIATLSLLTTDDLQTLQELTPEAQERILALSNLQDATASTRLGRAAAITALSLAAGVGFGVAIVAINIAASVGFATLWAAKSIFITVVTSSTVFLGFLTSPIIAGPTLVFLPITLTYLGLYLVGISGTRGAVLGLVIGNGNRAGMVVQVRHTNALGRNWSGWTTVGDGQTSTAPALMRPEDDDSVDLLYAGQWMATIGAETHLATRSKFQIRAGATVITDVDDESKAEGGSTPTSWVESPVYYTADWVNAQFDTAGNYLPTDPGPPLYQERPPREEEFSG